MTYNSNPCTQAEYKQRNSPGGLNYKFIGNMALLSIYAYWEDSCRSKLAKHHKVKKRLIKSNIFGDIRILRNSIIHHNGIALPNVEKCKLFKWYRTDDEIFIDGEQLEDIVAAIKDTQNDLYYID